MAKEPRDWFDWLMLLLVLLQTGIQLIKKDQSQTKGKPPYRNRRKRKR